MEILKDDEIRLARLMPGQWHDPLSCELFSCSLSTLPPYKALSYAWGASKLSCIIKTPSENRKITANLDYAFRQARKQDHAVVVWADALCINQDDELEKSHQVSLMRDIYEHCEEVLICLRPIQGHGRYSLDSARRPTSPVQLLNDQADKPLIKAFDAFYGNASNSEGSGRILTTLSTETATFVLLRLFAEPLYMSNIGALFNYTESKKNAERWDNIFEDLRQLIRQPWWNRVWTIQEVVVPEKATVMYGRAVAPWNMFANAASSYASNLRCSGFLRSILPAHTKILSRLFSMITTIENMRRQWRTGANTTLLQLLTQFRIREASDDRDKINGLLGLIRDGAINVRPDYTLPVVQTYTHAAMEILRSTRCLSYLAINVSSKARYGLPSWVPDWNPAIGYSNIHRQSHIDLYHTALEPLKSFELLGDRVLQVPGLRIGEVVSVGQPVISEDVLDSKALQEWYLSISEQHLRGNSKIIRYSFWMTLIANVICVPPNYRHPASQLPRFRIARASDLSSFLMWCIYSSESPFREECGIIYHSIRERARILSAGGVPDVEKNRFLSGKAGSLFYGLIADLINPLPDHPQESELPIISESIRWATSRRRLFSTILESPLYNMQTAALGLGPASMQEGDLIYLLQGGRTPFILRKTHETGPDTPGLPHYTLIGDCYQYDLMNSEAVFKSVANERPWLRAEHHRHPIRQDWRPVQQDSHPVQRGWHSVRLL